jgi:hypothetical protein
VGFPALYQLEAAGQGGAWSLVSQHRLLPRVRRAHAHTPGLGQGTPPPELGGRPPPRLHPAEPKPKLPIQHWESSGALLARGPLCPDSTALRVSRATSPGPWAAPRPATRDKEPQCDLAGASRPGASAQLSPRPYPAPSDARLQGARPGRGVRGDRSGAGLPSHPAPPPDTPQSCRAGAPSPGRTPPHTHTHTPGGAQVGCEPGVSPPPAQRPQCCPRATAPDRCLWGLHPARGHRVARFGSPECTFEGADLVLDGSRGVHLSAGGLRAAL